MTQQVRGAIFHNAGTTTIDMVKITFKEHQDIDPLKTRVPTCGQFQNITKNVVNIKDSSRWPEIISIN